MRLCILPDTPACVLSCLTCMQRYAQHSECLASRKGSTPPDNLEQAWYRGCRWRILSCLPRTVALVLKALTQALWLLAMLLFWMPSPDVILLQASQ